MLIKIIYPINGLITYKIHSQKRDVNLHDLQNHFLNNETVRIADVKAPRLLRIHPSHEGN